MWNKKKEQEAKILKNKLIQSWPQVPVRAETVMNRGAELDQRSSGGNIK